MTFSSTRNKITPRLVAVLVLLFCGMAALAGIQLKAYRDGMLHEREKETRTLVENVNSLILFYYAKVSQEDMSQNDAKAYAVQAIRLLNANDSGYFWIMDRTGKIIMHATQPDLKEQSVYDVHDRNGTYMFREMLDIVAHKGAGFVHYEWSKPGAPPQESYPKLSYVKSFAPWDWVIGSGLYLDDVDRAFRHALYVTGALGATMILFMLGLILMTSEGLKKDPPLE